MKNIAVAFIEWVMSSTEWKHYDDNATTWTDGTNVITTNDLFEIYKTKEKSSKKAKGEAC